MAKKTEISVVIWRTPGQGWPDLNDRASSVAKATAEFFNAPEHEVTVKAGASYLNILVSKVVRPYSQLEFMDYADSVVPLGCTVVAEQTSKLNFVRNAREEADNG